MFLSATAAAVTTLFTQGSLVDSDGKAVESADAGGLKVVNAELKAAKLTKTDAVAIKTLSKDDAAAIKAFANEIKAVDKFVVNDVKKLESDGNALAKKPTNAKLLAAVAALKTTLTTQSANSLSALTTDASTLQSSDDANSSALVTANPTLILLGTDVSNYQAALGTPLSNLSAAITLALTTDLSNVLVLY